MTAAKAAPVRQEPAYVVPVGSDPILWRVAAAWANVPVAELLADTAPVKAAHYQAALRVDKTFDEWLERHDEEAKLRAEEAAASGHPLAADIVQDEEGHFARLMLLAEGFAGLTATYRDSGDAAMAAEYAGFEQVLLQTAAKIQTMNDIQKVEK